LTYYNSSWSTIFVCKITLEILSTESVSEGRSWSKKSSAVRRVALSAIPVLRPSVKWVERFLLIRDVIL
jgi:hypothetical protein